MEDGEGEEQQERSGGGAELGGARRHTSWAADSTALARLAAVQPLHSPAMAQ